MTQLRSLNCPSCGAPLQVQEGQSILICKYCRDTIRLDTPTTPPPPASPPVPPPVVVPPYIRPARPAPRARSTAGPAGCGCAAVIGLGTALFVASLLVLTGAIRLPASLQKSLQDVVPLNLTLFESAILVPAANDTPPEIVAFAQQNGSSDLQRMLVKVDAAGKLVWQAAPFAGGSDNYLFPNQLLVRSGMVYAALENTLYAFHFADGSSAWQVRLSDKVSPNCVDCLQSYGSRVVVLATDGNLQAFAADSGQAQWLVTLQGTPDHLYALGEGPAVIDEDAQGAALLVFDPATGDVRRRLGPQCPAAGGFSPSDLSGFDTTVWYDTQAQALYLAYGRLDVCVQRWTLAQGSETMDWEAVFNSDEGFSPADAVTLVPGGDTLFVSSGGDTAWAIATATGERHRLVQADHMELNVLGSQAGVVLVSAADTRGTRQYALWGVAQESGEVLWRYSLGEAAPMTGLDDHTTIFSDGAAWTGRLAGGQVQIVQAQGKPQQLQLQTLNLADGTSNSTTTLPLTRLDTGSYSAGVLGWQGPRLWLWLEYHFYEINLETGQLDWTWP